MAHRIEHLDGQHILLEQGVEDVVERDLHPLLELLREHRHAPLPELLEEDVVQGRARSARLEAPALAAAADDLVVEQREVSELPRKARLAVEDLAVDNHAQTQAPAGIDVEHRLLVVRIAVHVFAVGRRARVVLDVDRRAEPLLKQHRERLLLDEKVAVAVSRLRIHPARDVHPDGQHLVARDLVRADEVQDHLAELVQRVGIVVHLERHGRLVDELSLEVDRRHHHRVLADVHADEVARIGVQPVDVGAPAAGRPLLAEIVDEPLVDQFADQFGHRRHAQIHGLAQVRDARIAAQNILTDDLLLQNRILVALRGQFEKRIGHDRIFCCIYIDM